MERIFNIITNIIIFCLVVSALLHIPLYASDSTEYKFLVTLQITIQIAGIATLLFVKKHIPKALLVFSLLTILFAGINTTFINYGNIEAHASFFILFWVVYGGLAYRIKGSFMYMHTVPNKRLWR